MLRSFRVANHRSIRAEQELVLLPAYDKSRPVTPVAAIYGANASGKSNLLDALRWMREAVLTSHLGWMKSSGVPRIPYRLDPSAMEEPSEFAVDVELAGVRYHYGFSVDSRIVRTEWLYSYPRNRRRVIFERSDSDFAFGTTVSGQPDVVRRLVRPNSLFLTVAGRSEIAETEPLLAWFDSILLYDRQNIIDREFVGRLRREGPERDELLDLVRAADVGITDILTRADRTAQDLRSVLSELPDDDLRDADVVARDEHDPERWHLVRAGGEPFTIRWSDEREGSIVAFRQGEHGLTLSLEEQSAGTRAWIDIVSVALDVLADGRLMLVDELDNSLHPRLSARLVELFEDPRTNPHTAQLVFTTHDATLLGTSLGVPVLHRDQIWFVEKSAAGVSHLFPLTDFHPRKDENTERRYLGGSYGAVPAIYSDSLVERLVSFREDSGRAAS